MGEIIRLGSMLGLGLGALHFAHIVLSRSFELDGVSKKTIWHGLGIWALWILFGAYLLFFWLIGWALLLASKALSRRGEPR